MSHELSETAARERKRLARQISATLLGPMVGRMPKSSIESLEKLSYYDNIERHILEIHPMTEPAIVRHDIDGSFPPFIRREAVFGRRNLYLLSDAVVSPTSGMVWIEERIVEESVGSLRRIMGWGDLLHEPLLPVRELEVEEPVVACHPANYYHFLLEVLPNLIFALARFPQARILVPERCPPYLIQGLATLLGPQPQERFIASPGPVRVARLVMPQYHARPEFTSPQVLQLLRSELQPKGVGCSRADGCGGKIYVSRRRSRRRRLAGEELLEERLAERGFEIVYCEELGFEEQIRLFRRARTVVGTHGAGLSNLVWGEPSCRVIEIFPKNYILDCYAWLSFTLGFDYRYVICGNGHELDAAAIDAVLELV